MDIAAWLQDLGLERYAPAFRDNDVDAEVLRKLTADDLISIGVTSVGHRRKLLDAIAEFGKAGATGTAPAAIVTAAPSDAPAPPARCRTPPADGDVLRPGRLDGALDPS